MKDQTHKHLYITRVISGLQISGPCCYCVTKCLSPAIDSYPKQMMREGFVLWMFVKSLVQ